MEFEEIEPTKYPEIPDPLYIDTLCDKVDCSSEATTEWTYTDAKGKLRTTARCDEHPETRSYDEAAEDDREQMLDLATNWEMGK